MYAAARVHHEPSAKAAFSEPLVCWRVLCDLYESEVAFQQRRVPRSRIAR